MSDDINQIDTRPIGYIWIAEPPIIHTRTNFPIDSEDVQDFLHDCLEEFRTRCQDTQNQISRYKNQLGSTVGSCRVGIGGYKSDNFQSLVSEIDLPDTIVVLDFNQIGGTAQEQIEMIQYARAKGILTLSLAHTSLIGLPREAAFTLLDDWVIRDLNRQLKPSKKSTTDQYSELVRLMKLGYSVTDISRETGWSRSTVFRLRRDNHAQLMRDVPGFGDIPEPKSALENIVESVRKVGRPRKIRPITEEEEDDN